MLIQPYIENAVIHGVRNVKNGKIQIIFRQPDEDLLLCTVEDNGVGRELSETKSSTFGDKHKSMGTAITEERLLTLNRRRKRQISVQTIDLMEDGNPEGTRVEIRIHIEG